MQKEFAPGHFFEYSFRFYDYEQYFVLGDEVSVTIISSIIAVLLVILVISSNLLITILVGLCIICTDILLVGMVYYVGLTLNPLVIL